MHVQKTPYTSTYGDVLKMHTFAKEMDYIVEFLAKIMKNDCKLDHFLLR